MARPRGSPFPRVADRGKRADELRRHLVQRADELGDRGLHRPHELRDAARRVTAAMQARQPPWPTSTGGIAPPVITNLSCPSRTRSAPWPPPPDRGRCRTRAGRSSVGELANGVFFTARRARVFLRTRKYTPDGALSREARVMSATSIPRYSARTMAWASATCFAISATTACFSSILRPKVYLHDSNAVRIAVRSHESVTLRQENPVLGNAICVGSAAGQAMRRCAAAPSNDAFD